jgi:osmoprotectant transport system ATP-binding protein
MCPASFEIEIDHASKSYDGGTNFALRDVSFAVRAGEFCAVVGTSGSGKTTLLKLINRLVEPTQGTIRVGGEDVKTMDAVLLRRRIGYVFQEVGLFPHMSVAENIAAAPKLLRWGKDEIAVRVRELLDLVQLPQDLAARRPSTLSGGQRQRVGLARAIAARPKIVLMDEPFGAVDPITREALAADYRALHDSLGLTTVMITHDILEAVLLSDRLAVMRGGKILEEGTPHAMLTGATDRYVRDLMAMPRRQSERVRGLAETRDATA